MLILDIGEMSSRENTTQESIRKQLLARLKKGELYSRIHPQLLQPDELFPCYPATGHSQSAATLSPFAVFNQPGPWEWETEHLSAKRISYFYPPGRRAGPAVQKRAFDLLLLYYDLAHPHRYGDYTWFDLDYQQSPYYPLTADLMAILTRHRVPAPPAQDAVEAWQTPEPDDFGVEVRMAAGPSQRGQLVVAISFARGEWQHTRAFRLGVDRYGFVRQQLITVLGGRLEPVKPDAVPAGRYRGRVYRRPGLKKI